VESINIEDLEGLLRAALRVDAHSVKFMVIVRQLRYKSRTELATAGLKD